MEEINIDVRNNFLKFENLVKGKKFCQEKQINLSEKRQNRNDTNFCDSVVVHENITDNINLITEVKTNNYKDFKFKLRCKDFTQRPFFRYDSAGSTHFNRNPETMLAEQQVTTPHFHTYDENGLSFAYKTEKLLDEKEATALENINLGFIHFCFEANLHYPEDVISEIICVPSGELGLDVSNDDILSNIRF